MNDPYETRQYPVPSAEALSLQSQISEIKQQQSKLFSDFASGQQRFRNLARSVWRVQEDERRRFARDLHDGLGQNITVILHQLEQAVNDIESTGSTQRIERAIDMCHRALNETRSLARMLRPKILDDLGLQAALSWLARTISESSGVSIEIECEAQYPDPQGEIATLCFRLVQESLNNVVKHAKASNVLIKISVKGKFLSLLVVDDGIGCNPEDAIAKDSAGSSTGIGSMRERVALFGGQLNLISSPGDGTQIRASIPLYTKESTV
jgi:signal transduction histidine kinase